MTDATGSGIGEWRILAEMTSKKEQVTLLINSSFLSPEVQALYLQYYTDKLGRLKPT